MPTETGLSEDTKIANSRKAFSRKEIQLDSRNLWVCDGLLGQVCCEFRAHHEIASGAILIFVSKFDDFFFTLSANGYGTYFP